MVGAWALVTLVLELVVTSVLVETCVAIAVALVAPLPVEVEVVA